MVGRCLVKKLFASRNIHNQLGELNNESQKKWLLSVMAVIFVAVLTACGKSSSAPKQVLNLSAAAPLDTIDISKAMGYGQTGNVYESIFRLGKNGKTVPGWLKVHVCQRMD